jgi:translation elongation factor P
LKISGVDIRPGNIIEYEGGIWRAVKIQHTQPGKGGAYMQVELKNLIDGRKNNVRFRSAETVERVRLDTKDFQFLFADGDQLTFMDKDNYDQVSLDRGILGEAAAFLQDGMDVVMELYDERPISVQLPTRSRRRWSRPTRREGADRVVVLQARGAGEWCARHGAAVHRGGRAGSWSTSTRQEYVAARSRLLSPLPQAGEEFDGTICPRHIVGHAGGMTGRQTGEGLLSSLGSGTREALTLPLAAAAGPLPLPWGEGL